jgi:hypothetical protein
MQPEHRLHKKLQAQIKGAGGCIFKIHGGDNPFQAVGIPDLLCCIQGRFVGIEVKMPGGSLRPAQVAALNEIYRAGGIAAVVETVEQGRKLLSVITGGGLRADLPVLFDRGFVSHVWGKGPKRS